MKYPESDRRLEARKRLADTEWAQTVKKGSKSELEAYLAKYPDGYYRARAELLLKAAGQSPGHSDELAIARRVLAEAQKTVDKSPITSGWDVAVIDFLDGNVFFNLNQGPTVSGTPSQTEALNMLLAQNEAHKKTCALLVLRIKAIETCLTAFNDERARFDRSIPLSVAIQDAISRFYLPALRGGKQLSTERLLELLDLMGRAEADVPQATDVFMAEVYLQLGLENEAIYRFYRYGQTAPAYNVTHYAAKQLRQVNPAIADHPDFVWVLRRYGE